MLCYLRPFAAPAADFMLTETSWRNSGLMWSFCTIFTLPEYHSDGNLKKASDTQFAIYRRLIARHPDWMASIGSKRNLIGLVKSGGKIGVTILMEGAEPVESPENLQSFFDQGVRALGLTWSNRNKYAGGNKTDGGLTEKGRALVNEAANLGMVIDVSHLNRESFWDLIDYRKSRLPGLKLVASHANADAVCPSDRNLDDRQLAALREAGACVGIILHNEFLMPGWKDTEFGIKKPLGPLEVFAEGIEPDALAEALAASATEPAEIEDFKPGAQRQDEVSLDIVLDHIEHIRYAMGDAAVGIGSDFDGGLTKYNTPTPFEDLAGLQALGEAVADKLGREFAAKVMSDNLMDYWLKNLPD